MNLPIDCNTLQLARFNRLFRTVRINLHLVTFDLSIPSKRENTWRVFKLLLTLLMASHWAGAVFFLIPMYFPSDVGDAWTETSSWQTNATQVR